MVHLGLGEAKLIGKHAEELFSAPGFSGRVLAVVTDAIYLQMADAEILWLAQNNVPMHARALRGDFDLSRLRVGMSFRSDGARLQFDVRAQRVAPLQFADTRVWQPAMFDPARVAPSEVVRTRAEKWYTAAQGNHTGLPLQNDIARACRDRDLACVTEIVRGLIGLGDGLTPSGDDFVGGLLFAVYHLRAAYPGAVRWEQRAIDDLLEYARGRTNDISHALLRDHARGQGAEPLHDWIAAMLSVGEPGDMARLAARLIEIGSTTGKNILAGAATGMFLLAAD